MPRLIDADALMKAINDDERGKNIHKMRSGKLLLSTQIILEHLHFAPTIEAEPVNATDTNVGSKWIPVTERLPEDEWEKIRKEHDADLYPCLCYRRSYSRYDKWFVTKVYFDGVYFVDLDNVILDEYITHWMPLPKPPEDGGDENGFQ